VDKRVNATTLRASGAEADCRAGDDYHTLARWMAAMLPLYEEPWFMFRFAEARIVPRFHLEGVEAGRRVSVFKIHPGTGERLALLATATVGEGGWVDLNEPIILRAGEAFVAVPEPVG
jgi:hypothetical protein